MSYVDTDRAILAGGSYGGYMANFVQGSPLGRKLKCIVSHESLFSKSRHPQVNPPSLTMKPCSLLTDFTDTQMLLAGDVLDYDTEFGGKPFPWDNFEGLEKWNPARPDRLKEWKTPMMIIHNDKDYRCEFGGGLAAFHTLQALGIECRFLNFPDEVSCLTLIWT